MIGKVLQLQPGVNKTTPNFHNRMDKMITKEVKLTLTGRVENRQYWYDDEPERRGWYITDEKIDLSSLLQDVNGRKVKITIETIED